MDNNEYNVCHQFQWFQLEVTFDASPTESKLFHFPVTSLPWMLSNQVFICQIYELLIAIESVMIIIIKLLALKSTVLRHERPCCSMEQTDNISLMRKNNNGRKHDVSLFLLKLWQFVCIVFRFLVKVTVLSRALNCRLHFFLLLYYRFPISCPSYSFIKFFKFSSARFFFNRFPISHFSLLCLLLFVCGIFILLFWYWLFGLINRQKPIWGHKEIQFKWLKYCISLRKIARYWKVL